MIEIDTSQASQDVLSFIIQKMSSGTRAKRSESNNIIVLADFSRKKKNIIAPRNSVGDIVTQLTHMLERTNSPISENASHAKFFNRRIKKIIRKKMKKSFFSHLECIRMAVRDFQSVPLSDLLKSVQTGQK